MNFPTFTAAGWTPVSLLIQAAAFVCTVIYCSFFEWTLHRNVMHKRTWISHPFELHAMSHHVLFKHDETYHALDDNMKSHVTFVPRDYILLILVNTPIFMAVEWATKLPILAGCWGAVLAYLVMFDVLHWSFHVPNERRMERWGWVRWLKEHHRLHHYRMNRNLNVVFPLADLLFGTRISTEREPRPAEPVAKETVS